MTGSDSQLRTECTVAFPLAAPFAYVNPGQLMVIGYLLRAGALTRVVRSRRVAGLHWLPCCTSCDEFGTESQLLAARLLGAQVEQGRRCNRDKFDTEKDRR
ncbi:hypothetical protein BaRGS_00025749 [Batillaria attramentaria]|uniref:Uncharacterized protein n=1 Tax=Batillaria attramentaria TaxID=370345 RepID=A0ABD0K7N0_9CAEN